MSDIAIHFDTEAAAFDAEIYKGDFIADDGLRTAVLVSLFTDREDTDAASGERRGWCLDALGADADDRWGSLLWKLERATLTDQRLAEARQYIEQALAWLISDRLARSVSVVTYRRNDERIDAQIDIARPDGVQRLRLSELWDASFVDPFQASREEAAAVAHDAALYQSILFGDLPEITS